MRHTLILGMSWSGSAQIGFVTRRSASEKVLGLRALTLHSSESHCEHTFIMRECSIGSNSTIVDWCYFARELCLTVLGKPIWGPGKIVDVDESKFCTTGDGGLKANGYLEGLKGGQRGALW